MKNKKILEMNEQFCIKRLFYVPVEILFCSVLSWNRRVSWQTARKLYKGPTLRAEFFFITTWHKLLLLVLQT